MKKAKTIQNNTPAWKVGLVLLALAVGGAWYWASRQRPTVAVPQEQRESGSPATASSEPSGADTAGIPPYFESALAAKPFPKLLPAAYFSNTPLVARAYRAAAEMPGVVAQQPCYCFCDRYAHKSLLDCYASDHAAG